MNKIPEYVENALFNWEETAFFAYDCYETIGRIAIGIEKDPDYPEEVILTAIQHDYKNGRPDKKTAKMIENYDPENEIIIQFMQEDGKVHTQKIKTAPGEPHPKRIYFFEIMRQLTEESEINISELPAWIVEAFKSLGNIQKDKDAH